VTAAVPRVAATTSERSRTEITAAIDSAFGDRAALADRYADLLSTAGITRGLLGPREAARIWERHLLNSAAIAPLIPAAARVVDLGSGAGLPGIPLAIARPDLTMVLLEPMQRRVAFLHDCLAELQLKNVSIRHARAEAGLQPLADVVVARAVAPLDRLLQLCEPLLVADGTLLALKGQTAADELAQLRRGPSVEAELLSLPALGQPATVIRVSRAGWSHTSSQSGRARGGRR
jgi:16S rRNA (guanine527-N7)-methyltransferase